MDIFKLLSRSSSLQHKKKPAPQTPALADPNTKVGVHSSGGPGSNKKRKAGTTTTASTTAILPIGQAPPELDFFGASPAPQGTKLGGAAQSSPKKKRKRAKNGVSPVAESDESDRDTSSLDEDDEENELRSNFSGLLENVSPPPLLPSPEETYKLAKAHKLKITLMNPLPKPSPLSQQPAGKKKRPSSRKSTSATPDPDPVKKIKPVDTTPSILLTAFTQLRVAPYTLSKQLYRNLLSHGYSTPTPVQMASIPLLLLGHDYVPTSNAAPAAALPLSRMRTKSPINLLTCAQTGSGKTMAYLIPLMDWVLWKRGQKGAEGRSKRGTKAIILAPTRELVGQICNEGLKLAIGTGVRITILKKAVVGKLKLGREDDMLAKNSRDGEEVCDEIEEEGGVSLPRDLPEKQMSSLRVVKSDIVVTTPAMLNHAIHNATIELQTVQRLVLDEADVLLESNDKGGGFGEETLSAWEKLKAASADIRVSMWSATVSSSVEALATSIFTASTSSAPPFLRLLTGVKNTSLPHILHTLTYVSTEQGKLLSLRNLLTTSFPLPALIFLQTVPRATALYDEIQYDLLPGRIALLHAQLPDVQREDVMDRFRRGDIWALVTTDLLSRGVDWRGVRLVINYDIPSSATAYIHRAGRTGRGGKEGGEVITYWTAGDVKIIRPIAEVIAQAEKEKERLDSAAIALGGGGRTGAVVGNVHTKNGQGGPREGSAVWLLDFLPKVAKEEKKRLKKFGVETRNPRRLNAVDKIGKGEGHVRRKGRDIANREGIYRISTVSEWERRRENRLKGAIEASKKRRRVEEEEGEEEEEEEWVGFS